MSMNKTVDQRVVEMQFNNGDFEQKVAKTLESLSKLRETSKMEDAGKGMQNLAKGVKDVDINRLTAGIDALNQKFSVLGIAGQEVIRKLTDGFMNMANAAIGAITEAPKSGWQEYELYTDSVKTILNSAKDAQGLPVTLDAVNKKLAELNEYSDKTIYSFSDMTTNIGKFTNAGVDLDRSVLAIKGIANAAALAGANSQQASNAMYNFAQALSTGYIQRIDWKSIENAQMATVDFKQALVDTAVNLKTLKKEGDKYVTLTTNLQGKTSDAMGTMQLFSDGLSYQWMTADVLIDTLKRYSDELDPLGAKASAAAQEVTTFSKMIDTLKESMGSGWMNIWQDIFGDFEEQKALWTGVYQEIDGIIQGIFSFWHNTAEGETPGVLNVWKDLGGRDDLIEGFKNLWRAAKEFLSPVKELFAGLIPPITGKSLAVLTRDFREFTARLAPVKEVAEEVSKKVEEIGDKTEEVAATAEKFKQVTEEIIAGKWGDGQERIDKLNEAGFAFENLQNAVNNTLGAQKRYETTMSDNEAVGEKVAENTEKQAEGQKNFREEIKKSNDELFVHKGAVENLAYVFLGVSSAVKLAVAVVDKGVETFKKFSGGIHPVAAAAGLLLDVLGNLGRHMYNLNTWLIQFDSLGAVIDAIQRKLGELFGANGEGFAQFGVSIVQLGGVRKLLGEIERGFDFIVGKVTNFKTKLDNLATTDGLSGVRKSLDILGKYVGGFLITAFNALSGAIVDAIGAIQQLWTKLRSMTIVSSIINSFTSAKNSIVGFWQSLNETTEGQEKYTNRLKEFKDTLSTVVSVISKLAGKAFGFLLNRLTDLENLTQNVIQTLTANGVLNGATDTWNKFKAVLVELPDIIDKFFDSLNKGKVPTLGELSANLSGFVNGLVALKNNIKKSVGTVFENLITGIMEKFTALSQLSLPDKLQQFVDRIKSIFKDFGGMTISASTSVSDFAKKVVGVLGKLDFKGLAIGGFLTSIALFLARWSKVGKNASKSFKALTEFIKNGGKAAVDIKEKYSGFLKIGAAIALIAASIWLLSKVPAERFWQCVGVIGAAFVALGAAVIYLTKAKIEEDRLKGIGIAFAGLGASMILLAGAVKAFGAMDPIEMAKGLTIVGVAIAGMVLAIRNIGEVSDGAGAAFAGLAAGVLILSVAVKAFSMMSPDTLIKGGAAVTYFVFVMAAAMRVAGDVDAKGFVGLAASVLILMAAVKALGKMKTSTLVKGEIGVIALITAVALSSKAAKDVDGDSFKSMAQAIKILTVAMFVLSKIPTLQLIAVTASLVIIFKSLTTAAKELKEVDYKDSAKIAVAMLAMLIPVGAVLLLLSKMTDPQAVLSISIGLAAVLWGLAQVGPAIKLLSAIDFVAGLKAIALLDIMLGSLAAVVAILGAIVMSNSGVGDALVTGCETIGRAINALLTNLIFGDDDPSEVISSIGDALSGFGTKIKDFIDTVSGMPEGTAENAKNLASAILAICGAEVLEAIAGWISGKSNFDKFGEAIDGVITAILRINEAVGDGELNNKAIKSVVSATKSLVEIANALPKQGGLLQGLTGTQDLGDFAGQMATFINGGFRTFLSSLNLLGDKLGVGFVAKCIMIKDGVKQLVDIANSLPSSGFSLKSMIFGNQDLTKFAEQMAGFMKGGFSEFVTEVNGLPDVDTATIQSKVVPVTEAMIQLGKKLGDNTSIITRFTGQSDLSLFATNLAAFGKGILEFSLAIAGVQPTSIDAMTASMEKMAALNASENISSSNLATFASCITGLGESIKLFGENTATVTPEYLTTIIGKLADLHNLMLILSATDYSGVSGFVESLEMLATSGVEGFVAKFKEDADSAAEAAKSLVDAVCNGITQNLGDVTESGKGTVMMFVKGLTQPMLIVIVMASGAKLVTKVVEGITSSLKSVYDAGGSLVLKFCAGISNKNPGMPKGAGQSISRKVLEGINEYLDDFEDKGEDAAKGFAQGIRNKADEAARAAANMVKDAIEAARKAQDSASPSKKFRKLGHDGGEGYGLGFVDMISYVGRSVKSMGYAGLNAMRETVAQINEMVDEEMNASPTITPVMDLSLLSSGMSTTRSIMAELNGIHTDAKAAFDISAAHNDALVKAKTKGNVDYTDILNRLAERSDDILTAAKKNRVAVIDGDYLYGYVDTRLGMA